MSARALAALARFDSESRRPLFDRDATVMRQSVATLTPPSDPKVRRALVYLEQHPDATANRAALHVGGRRVDALAAVRTARSLLGTNGNWFPRPAVARPTCDLASTVRDARSHAEAS